MGIQLIRGDDHARPRLLNLAAKRRVQSNEMHLTARQAGSIARAAGARLVTPFHFSPRYAGREAELRAEVEAAWNGSPGHRRA
jgi:ribonuclease Z